MSRGKYDDILNLPHHTSHRRPQMSIADRAAQFAPFAALTGYDCVIEETGRLTDNMVVLDENQRYELDLQLNSLMQVIDSNPPVTVTYFQPDSKKQGGSYCSVESFLKKIDEIQRLMILVDGSEIPLDSIVSLICSQL